MTSAKAAPAVVADLTDHLLPRMLRAARLDETLYEEVEHDKHATPQAAFIVVASSIAAAYGGIGGVSDPTGGLLVATGWLISWALYAWLALLIGSRVPGGHKGSDWGEVARALGFANVPRFFLVFALLVPGSTELVLLVALWLCATTVVALRSALEIKTRWAIFTALVALVAQPIAIFILLGSLALLIQTFGVPLG